jgi:hypothetical protein
MSRARGGGVAVVAAAAAAGFVDARAGLGRRGGGRREGRDGDGRYWKQPESAKFTIARGDFSTERTLLSHNDTLPPSVSRQVFHTKIGRTILPRHYECTSLDTVPDNAINYKESFRISTDHSLRRIDLCARRISRCKDSTVEFLPVLPFSCSLLPVSLLTLVTTG